MNKAMAIQQMYPDADPTVDFIVRDEGDGVQTITVWNLPYPLPTDAELQTAFLNALKAERINEFNMKCNQTILSGFTSTSMGYKYGFNDLDQMNMTQQMILFLNDTTLVDVYWKTESAGVLLHTRDQFMGVTKEADQHKRSWINHYWNKKNEINACTTVSAVNAVTW